MAGVEERFKLLELPYDKDADIDYYLKNYLDCMFTQPFSLFSIVFNENSIDGRIFKIVIRDLSIKEEFEVENLYKKEIKNYEEWGDNLKNLIKLYFSLHRFELIEGDGNVKVLISDEKRLNPSSFLEILEFFDNNLPSSAFFNILLPRFSKFLKIKNDIMREMINKNFF